jgi:predicted RNA binding protein YcfA (HicA-like mRNA interferase family)
LSIEKQLAPLVFVHQVRQKCVAVARLVAVKRRDLVRELRRMAAEAGQPFAQDRNRGGHAVYRIAGRSVPVPNHVEINEHTARGILRDVAADITEKGRKQS